MTEDTNNVTIDFASMFPIHTVENRISARDVRHILNTYYGSMLFGDNESIYDVNVEEETTFESLHKVLEC